MPSSPNYKEVCKHCLLCNTQLKLKNNRDIDRKNFCSKICSNTYNSVNRESKEFVCEVCGLAFKTNATFAKYCGGCKMQAQVERSYKYLNDNPEGYIKHLLYKPSRRHLRVEQVVGLFGKQEGLCALSKVPMTFIKEVGSPKVHTNLSIDRIDPTKEYSIDNIQLVCAIVNIMKSTLTNEELVWWCSNIAAQGG